MEGKNTVDPNETLIMSGRCGSAVLANSAVVFFGTLRVNHVMSACFELTNGISCFI